MRERSRSHNRIVPQGTALGTWTRVKAIHQATYLVRTYWYGFYRQMRRHIYFVYSLFNIYALVVQLVRTSAP